MITQLATPIDADGFWQGEFFLSDKLYALPGSTTDILANMTFRRTHVNRTPPPSSWWWNGPAPSDYVLASTETGEIVPTGNSLVVSLRLADGEYSVLGETIINLPDLMTSVRFPFVNGVLRIGNGLAQMMARPFKRRTLTTIISLPTSAPVGGGLWNNGGIVSAAEPYSAVDLSVLGDLSALPIYPPQVQNSLWLDGNVVAITGPQPGVPETMPDTTGTPWIDGGVLAVT